MTNKRLFAVILAGLVFLQGHAQESSALSFVSIDRNPATAAMGGAQAVSALYNPSAIPFSGSDAVLSYQMWAPKTFNSGNMNLLAAFKIGDKLGISVSGAYQMGQEYTLVNESGISGKTFRPSDMLVGVGVGFRFTEIPVCRRFRPVCHAERSRTESLPPSPLTFSSCIIPARCPRRPVFPSGNEGQVRKGVLLPADSRQGRCRL